MSLDLGTLTGYLAVDESSWTGGFQKAIDKVATFGGTVPKWMGIASGAIVAGGVAAIGALYSIGSAWDDVSDTIRVGTGATGDALDGLVADAKNVARQVPADLSEIGPAVADLNTRLGLTGDGLTKVASQVLEVGRMLGTEVDIGTVTGAFNAFNIKGDATADKMDVLWNISQQTGVGFNELAASVQSAAPIVQQLGLDFDQTAVLIGQMDKAGLDSQGMIGAMTRGLAGMTEPGEDASATFNRVTGEIQSFIDKGDDAAARDLAGQVFGTRGAAQFVGALKSGAIDMAALGDAAFVTGDSILDAGQDTMDFAEKWQLVQNKASAALEPLGSAVFGALGSALDYVMPALDAFGAWAEENPGIMQAIAIALGVLAAGFLIAAAATWAMNSALLANPITWIILAVVALIAAIVLLAMNWDTVVAWISDVWAGFIGWMTGVIDGFVAWWNDIWGSVGSFFTTLWSDITGWVTQQFELFMLGLQIIGAAIASWWNGLWSGIGSFFQGLWNGVVNFAVSAFTAIWGFIQSVFAGVAGWWSGMWNGISSTFEAVWNGIGSFFKGVANWVIGLIEGFVNGAVDLINGITGGLSGAWTWLGIPAIPQIGHVRIARLAEGGVAKARPGGVPAIIAEAGQDEVVAPLDSMRSMMMEVAMIAARAGNGRAGVVVEMPVYGNVGWDAEEVARQVSDRQRQALALEGIDDLLAVA